MPANEPEPDRGSRRGIQHHAARGVSWTMLATAVTIPAAFAANVVLARVLGVEGYGRLAFLTAALELVLAVADIGITAAVVQFGSRAHARGRTEEVRRILAQAQGFRLLVVAPLLSVFLLVVLDVSTPVLVAGIVLGAWLPAGLAGINDSLTLENRSATAARLHLVTSVVTQLVVVLVALASRDADTTWLARLALTALAALVALPLVTRAYRAAVLRPAVPRGLPSGFWKFALPTGAASIVGGLVTSRSEVLLLEWMDSPAAVGVFALAFGVAAHVFGPANALTNPLLPAVSSLRAVDGDAVREAFFRVSRVSVAMVTGFLVVVVPSLAILIETIYGTEYDNAAALLVVLASGVAATTLAGPVMAFTLSRLRAVRVLTTGLVSLAVNLGLALALIPVLSVWGATVACVIAGTLRLALLVRDELTGLELTWSALTAQIGAFLMGSVAAFLVWLVAHQVPTTAAATAVSVLLGGLAWWAVLQVSHGTLTPGDRRQVLDVLPRRMRGPARWLLTPVTRS